MSGSRVILQFHIKPGGTPQTADGRRAAGKYARFFDMAEGFRRAFNNGERGACVAVALIPVFQAHEHACDVLPVPARARADGGEDGNNVIFLFGVEIVLNLLHHLQRLLLRRTAWQLNGGDKHAAIFQRQEEGWQTQEQEHHSA